LLQGEWKGSSAAGCLNYPSWVNNPQYRIVPNVTSWVSIVVIQSPECHEKKPTELDAIGCYVVEADGMEISREFSDYFQGMEFLKILLMLLQKVDLKILRMVRIFWLVGGVEEFCSWM
jgi:hypothetical protein